MNGSETRPAAGAGARRAAAGRRLRAAGPQGARSTAGSRARTTAAGDPGTRLTIGAVRTRRLAASEAAARPSGGAYGNPLRGTRESAPTIPSARPGSRGPTSPTPTGGAPTEWR